MSTLNISVTDQQAVLVDRWVTTYGFANRSELFRAILRYVDQHPEILRKLAGFKAKSLNK
ncbi:MAG: ribbon-helix-helix domain-containing protein [Patescibacteria group bacterium]|nr:ribbon-helix-helix domain-containing protein [Patescibacteria group bacterium]MCL5431776.1 ribbon-helix-helix domain-containing protein [Patescibacteria group bacterium]